MILNIITIEIFVGAVHNLNSSMPKKIGYSLNTTAATLKISAEDLQGLLKEFIKISPEYLAPIEKAVKNHDFKLAAAAAHRLKGAALELRIHNLADEALNIEKNAQAKNLKNYASHLARIRNIFKHLNNDLV
jgi:HPt (histidine-containing phosphotransfer) domain-containing protein